ncbi:hypothetical protein ScPMuIL_009711 [Solemya velum]
MAGLHVIYSEDELQKKIFTTECEQNTRFVQHRKRRRSLKFEELLSLTGYRIRFDECNHPSSVFPAIQYDGTPFVILNTEVYECHQGPQRAKHLKKRETAVDEDHSYLSSGKKRCYQTSKKRNCPAKIRVKRILKFPEYKIIGQPTARKKRQVSQQLKAEFSIQTRREPVTYVHIDSVDDHQYHLTGELAGFTQPIDKRVICQIKQLALEGHRNVSSVRILLKELAKELAPEAPENNRRFFPTNDDIRTHIYQTIVGSNLRSAQEDQANVRKLLETPGKFAEELKYLFRPASSDGEVINSLLLVIQTRFQQTLMAKYGAVTLMDATYKTTKYEIPLYNLCVQTNVGFFIVASFFLSADTTTCIAEALEVIKGWNPSWHPENFMCDFDMREIGALQSIFKDAPALLCDFHRITAWRKWLNSSDVPNKNDVLKQLQEIASAETELNYRCLLQKLKNSTTYKENEKLKNWFERKWLKEETRWAFCFRKDIFNIISTTNGIETQYKTLKHFYLKEFGIGKSLANVLEVLLDKFFPDSQLSYRRENIKSFEESRNYSPEVPAFLRNRPRKFMRHCLDRLPPNVNEIKKEDIQHCGEFLKVKSQDSNSVYEIKLQENMPSCSCKDFMVRNWPCKHFLAVYKLFEFNCLESYMGRLLFVLDKDVMKNEDNENTFELPIHKEEEKEEDQILDTEKIRKRSVALLSQIENYLYASQEKEVLEKAVQTLEELSTFLNNKIPKMDGLPLRKSRKKWQRRSGCASKWPKKKKREKQAKQKDRKLSVTSLPVSQVVDECWHPKYLTQGTVLARIGPYAIDDASIRHLRGAISDEVIDAYFHLLSVKAENRVLHVDCVVITAIFTGHIQRSGLLQNEKLEDYEAILGAVNEGGNHWTLVIIHPKERTILYLNPLGETHISEQKMLQNWYYFLREREMAGLNLIPVGTWSLRSPQHAKQADGISCGIYVIQLAENYLKKQSLLFKWTREDIITRRREIARYLLSQTEIAGDEVYQQTEVDSTEVVSTVKNTQRELRTNPPKRKSSIFIYEPVMKKTREKHCICQKKNDGKIYWQCGECTKWFHPSCLGILLEEKPDSFLCNFCEKARLVEKGAKGCEKSSTGDINEEALLHYLYAIMECSDDDCQEVEHKAHHKYVKAPIAAHKDELKKAGFGLNIFEEQFIEELVSKLESTLVINRRKDQRKPYTGGTFQSIKNLPETCDLARVLYKHKLFASFYVFDVLRKESLKFIHMSSSSSSYQYTSEKLEEHEIHYS